MVRARSLLSVTFGLCLTLGAACSKDKKEPTTPVASTTTAETTPTSTTAEAEKPAATAAAEPAKPDPAHDPEALKAAKVQVEGLKKMCADSATARAKRQKAKPLYTRLGGHDALKAVVTDIIELHATEDSTKALMVGVDKPHLVDLVVEFLGSNSGGKEKYTGRDMVAAHANLHMTDVHFLAAGEQIQRVLTKYKVPAPEQQEVMCLIVAHHDEAIRE